MNLGSRRPAFIDIHDVTHLYAGAGDGVPAVLNLHVKVKEGEFAAIVGPSGYGKSTLMKLATGLQFPKSGTAVMYTLTAMVERSMAGWAQRSQMATA